MTAADQLAKVRAVVAQVLADELADRQYALERIETILAQPVTRRARIDGSEAVTYVRPDGSAVLSVDDLRTVLDALSVAADHKRDQADVCGDCDGYPDGELCGTCEHRLRVADEYDALAERIRSGQ